MTNRYVYLGKKVKDIGKKGLDRPSEYLAIARAIAQDYKAGRISKKTAHGRFLLLYRLVDKNSKLKVPKSVKERLKRKIKEIWMKTIGGGKVARKRKRKKR
ncbi:MAG: hypothetical protein DRJ40_07350 [Thermoprotei archaeon]|nr:MAG: hypothetical protein DRJ40_07350 [Thermoprotei archaeon]